MASQRFAIKAPQFIKVLHLVIVCHDGIHIGNVVLLAAHFVSAFLAKQYPNWHVHYDVVHFACTSGLHEQHN